MDKDNIYYKLWQSERYGDPLPDTECDELENGVAEAEAFEEAMNQFFESQLDQ